MPPLKLRTEPDSILRTVCNEVSAVNNELRELITGMVICMNYHDGIGLAAPQIGLLHRLFVTHAPEDKIRVFINPTIISTSEQEVEIEEGCLSIPNTYGMVSRSRDIIVQAYNEDGQQFSLEATGMVARVILHECDHLKGVLFWDYLSPAKRKRLQARYQRS